MSMRGRREGGSRVFEPYGRRTDSLPGCPPQGSALHMTELLGISITGQMTAGELAVAVGTLLLAGFTVLMAHRTGREVELTRESIEAIDRPFLVGSFDGPEAFQLSPPSKSRSA
jgi:hypothetical protein